MAFHRARGGAQWVQSGFPGSPVQEDFTVLRKTALLSTLLLGACEPYSSPAPNIVSIEPEEVMSGEASTITLKLDAPLPVKVDYGKRAATLLMPTLVIGGQEVAIQGV